MKKLVSIVIFVIVLLLITGYFITRDRSSDEDQIIAAIEFGRSSVEKKLLNDALSVVSEDYADDFGNTRRSLASWARGLFQGEGRWTVAVDKPEIVINGNTAEAHTAVRLAVVDLEGVGAVHPRNITLHFRKEKARRLLIYPVERWRVIRMDGVADYMKNPL